MEIDRHMDLVYDLKMADKEGEIHTGSELEEYGRAMYSSGGDGKNITAGHMTPEQKAVWDASTTPSSSSSRPTASPARPSPNGSTAAT